MNTIHVTYHRYVKNQNKATVLVIFPCKNQTKMFKLSIFCFLGDIDNALKMSALKKFILCLNISKYVIYNLCSIDIEIESFNLLTSVRFSK